MPRGQRNNRGSPSLPRGRGRGRARGFRGASQGGRSRPDGANNGTFVFEGNFEDFNLNHIYPSSHPRTSPTRGGAGYQRPPRGGRVLRGIGFPNAHRIPVSLEDRPLLRPVVFVHGEHQKTLFQEVEEILHVHGEEGATIDDHVPSANMVERLLNRDASKVDVSPESGRVSSHTSDSEVEDEGTVAAADITVEEHEPSFIVDTLPSPIVLPFQRSEHVVEPSVQGVTPLGDTEDEDVIVYVAPHPRKSRYGSTVSTTHHPASEPRPITFQTSSLTEPGTSSGPPVSTPIDSIPIPLMTPYDPDKVLTAQVEARRRIGLKPTPRSRKMAKKERAAARRRDDRRTMFNFGLNMEERFALQEGPTTKDDTRRAARRRGDSDVDWGSDDESGIEEITSGVGDMSVDGEIGDVSTALAKFAREAEGLGTGEVVTIADLEDEKRMNEEDEELDADDPTDDEDNFDPEMRTEIEDDTRAESSESSDEETPRRGFHARLRKLRETAKGREVVDLDSPLDREANTDDEGVSGIELSWADRDERSLQVIEDLLNENDGMLRGGNRMARNKLFKADSEDEYDFFESLNLRKKNRNIPFQLRAQWERDRAKKAERKRNRARLAHIQATASPPLMRKGSGRNKQKIFGAARLDGDRIFVERVSDMTLLEQQIRNFLHDLELNTMILPPTGKDWRKQAHSLAVAFNLNSKSKGNGEGRFITLYKTSRSGIGVNERKISRLINGNKGGGFRTPVTQRSTMSVRHREGDEVGKAAPKLSETNMGFRLLQQMGWEEGDRIGVTGGLVDPLTAIIKTTKLGLGATR